uniref:Uncharacterized protein n=1 Tax=Glossina austeni TaxID=7395 RepID=A0A1A9V5Y0_GLOAU
MLDTVGCVAFITSSWIKNENFQSIADIDMKIDGNVHYDPPKRRTLSLSPTLGRISHIMKPNKFSTILLNSQKSNIAFKRLLVAHSFVRIEACGDSQILRNCKNNGFFVADLVALY